ncbi:MAG: diacylglycerol/lipid kinase family protein [Flavisolibacter sp.]
MHNQQGLKLLFIINPVSGGKEKHNWEASIREYYKDRSHNIEFYLLTGKNDKISIQHHIERINPDRVIAVGGDGTVKMMADILKETQTPLAILPAGSANGMAKELEIPAEIETALEVVTEGECKKIDIIRINEEHICIHLSDMGLNAMMVKYFEKSKKRGMWGYGKTMFRVLWEKQKMKVTIKTDSAEVKRNAYMVTIANARKYGTGANINPDGDVADGKFEVVVVRKLNLAEICKAIFTHRSFNKDKIEVFPTKNVEISIHHKAYFQIDGEYLGKTKSVQARVLPQILNVMLPRKTV